MDERAKVLSNREQAREKINLFHGSSNNWINMIKELIGNSLDIFKKTKQTNGEIQILIHNNNKIEFIDNARGIPVEVIASDGNPNYMAIFEKPFAGTNYENLIESVGQNGIFLWTLSMTSKNIEYFIARPNKNIYNIAYEKGERVKEFSIIGDSDSTYSRMIFELDEDIWENPNFTFEEIIPIAKVQSSRGNVRIIVKDLLHNKENEFYYKDGLNEYFEEITNNKSKVIDNIYIKSSKELDVKVKGKEVKEIFTTNLIFTYSNDNLDDVKKEFLNTADLIQYGTIQEGMILGLKNSIHKWLKNNEKYQKNEKGISIEDVYTGLNYVSDNTSLFVEYENQIKQKTSLKRYINLMKSIIEESMEIFFIENKIQTELLCNQVLINKRAREKSDTLRNTLKKKLENTTKNGKLKVEGLTDCDMKNSSLDERFLLVVEGLSPKETVVEAYDNRIFGALGLRGRFISCLKKSVEEVLNNVPAHTLIQALGCGIEIPYEERKKFKNIQTFNKENLRYGNIGILTDADCWGSGIRLALLTFIYKYLPTLLKENRVYIIISPRYEIKMKSGEMKYVYNDREKEAFMKTIKEEDIYNISIVKGIGEINKEDFWDKVLCEEAREKTFIRVNYDNFDEVVNKYFEDYMGEDTSARKEFVAEFITKVNLEDIN